MAAIKLASDFVRRFVASPTTVIVAFGVAVAAAAAAVTSTTITSIVALVAEARANWWWAH